MELALPIAGCVVLLLVVVVALARAPAAVMVVPPTPRSQDDILRDVGLAATGKVIFMQPTGKTVGDRREWHVTVEVTPPVGRPYRVNLVSLMGSAAEPLVRIGHHVPIRVNPKLATDVVLDV